MLDKSGLNEAVGNAKQPNEAIKIRKQYELLLQGEYKKIVRMVGKQYELFKKFKESEDFFNQIGLKFTLKIMLLTKLLTTFLMLRNSSLSPTYFNYNNLKVIKKYLVRKTRFFINTVASWFLFFLGNCVFFR